MRGVGLIAASSRATPRTPSAGQALLLGDGVITRAVAGAVALSPPLTLADDELDELGGGAAAHAEKLA